MQSNDLAVVGRSAIEAATSAPPQSWPNSKDSEFTYDFIAFTAVRAVSGPDSPLVESDQHPASLAWQDAQGLSGNEAVNVKCELYGSHSAIKLRYRKIKPCLLTKLARAAVGLFPSSLTTEYLQQSGFIIRWHTNALRRCGCSLQHRPEGRALKPSLTPCACGPRLGLQQIGRHPKTQE